VVVDDTGRIDFHYQVTDYESCITKMIRDLNKIHIDCLDRIINYKTYAPDYTEMKRKKKNGELSKEQLNEFNKGDIIHRYKTGEISEELIDEFNKSIISKKGDFSKEQLSDIIKNVKVVISTKRNQMNFMKFTKFIDLRIFVIYVIKQL